MSNAWCHAAYDVTISFEGTPLNAHARSQLFPGPRLPLSRSGAPSLSSLKHTLYSKTLHHDYWASPIWLAAAERPKLATLLPTLVQFTTIRRL